MSQKEYSNLIAHMSHTAIMLYGHIDPTVLLTYAKTQPTVIATLNVIAMYVPKTNMPIKCQICKSVHVQT